MNALTTLQTSAFALFNSGVEETSLPAETLHLRWEALHNLAAEVGAMAQLAREVTPVTVSEFSYRFANMDPARQTLALNGLTDIEAVMKPGKAALRNLHARGADTTAAALALWCEFHRSRQAILDLT